MSGPDSLRERFLARRSFIELSARARARAILDDGSFRELLDPFERLKSPWLPLQGVVAQADDGVVVARGTLDGHSAVVAAVEGAYQGGSIGEVSGSKIAGALELALRDAERGTPVRPVLVLETGGVRLQEANLGLAAIAEIHAAIVALRRHVPVVAVVSGTVGCFGGMSLAAALCSRLIVTRQARLGMNGPEVIEQEAGLAELDASDRALIWSLMGGEQRYATGFADLLVEDDAGEIAGAVRSAFAASTVAPSGNVPFGRVRMTHAHTGQTNILHPEPGDSPPRTQQVERFLGRLSRIDVEHAPEPAALRALWGREELP